MTSQSRGRAGARKPPIGRRFQPGQSGNPGGRPKEAAEVRELARSYTVEALEALAGLMRSGPPAVSARAAEALLERAWGRPSQEIGIALEAELRSALDRLKAALSPEAYVCALEALAVQQAPTAPGGRTDASTE
jgi:hypothetical protein